MTTVSNRPVGRALKTPTTAATKPAAQAPGVAQTLKATSLDVASFKDRPRPDDAPKYLMKRDWSGSRSSDIAMMLVGYGLGLPMAFGAAVTLMKSLFFPGALLGFGALFFMTVAWAFQAKVMR